MDRLTQDIRAAVRGFIAQPGFTAVAVLILALGIGANTAIYTLVDAVALRPLPVEQPDGLVRLGETDACCVNTGLQRSFSIFSYDLYLNLRDHTPELQSLAAFQVQPQLFSVRRAGSSVPVAPAVGEFVSANYFATLGVPMAAGRRLTIDDDRPGAAATVVLSYRTWRDQYGLDPAVVGAAFTVNAVSVTVVGVAAPAFYGETLRPNPPDLWLPFGIEPAVRGAGQRTGGSASLLTRSDQEWLYLVGRLRDPRALDQVQAKVSGELRAWLSAQPDWSPDDRLKIPDQHIVITSARTGVSALRARYADGLRALAIVSALVLVMACANLANLLLARAHPFQFALRTALGASRSRLVQQMITSGLLLAAAGGGAGMLVAYAATRAIVAMAFRGAGYVPIEAAPSPAILIFATAVSLVTGVVFSALPAWIMSTASPIDALRGAGRAIADRSALPRQGLVVLQVAVSLVLLVGAGLLTLSLSRLEHQAFGFQTDGRLMVRIDPAFAGYESSRLPGLYEKLQDDLRRLPGVASVSLSQYSPMEGNNWSGGISIEGRSPDRFPRDSASWLRVGPHYFETIGTRLIRGRAIDERDAPGALHVGVVNETFARAFFPGTDAIGRHVGIGDEPGHDMDFEIVGIVEDAKYLRAEEPAWATLFIPLLQTAPYRAEGFVSIQARSLYVRDIELHVGGTPAGLEADVRRTIAGIDPNLTVIGVMSFDEQLGRNFNQQRLIARLTALYGQLALLLAAVGLYGVTAHYVAKRTMEIGIRMALGADRRRVLMMVLRRALVQTAIGLAVGVPLAFAAGRALSSLLYDVTAHDPLVLNGAVIVLACSAFLAAIVPARRAASLDPIRALRGE